MSRARLKRTSGKYDNGSYAQIPRRVFSSDEMHRLQTDHPLCVVLLLQLLEQYHGSNNGDLAVALIRKWWRSSATLYKHLAILIAHGWVVKTREGWRGSHPRPALYALTWLPIDECKGNLELVQGTTRPSDTWKDGSKPVDIYIGVHLVNRSKGPTSSRGGPVTSPLGGPVQSTRRTGVFSDRERQMIDACQKLPTLSVPRWVKRKLGKHGNTIALRYDWPTSTLSAA